MTVKGISDETCVRAWPSDENGGITTMYNMMQLPYTLVVRVHQDNFEDEVAALIAKSFAQQLDMNLMGREYVFALDYEALKKEIEGIISGVQAGHESWIPKGIKVGVWLIPKKEEKPLITTHLGRPISGAESSRSGIVITFPKNKRAPTGP
ncbi:MAG: hypothetical protein AAF569_07725 [Pseudomonadota bacterium]